MHILDCILPLKIQIMHVHPFIKRQTVKSTTLPTHQQSLLSSTPFTYNNDCTFDPLDFNDGTIARRKATHKGFQVIILPVEINVRSSSPNLAVPHSLSCSEDTLECGSLWQFCTRASQLNTDHVTNRLVMRHI
jgi:hypothetical protein